MTHQLLLFGFWAVFTVWYLFLNWSKEDREESLHYCLEIWKYRTVVFPNTEQNTRFCCWVSWLCLAVLQWQLLARNQSTIKGQRKCLFLTHQWQKPSHGISLCLGAFSPQWAHQPTVNTSSVWPLPWHFHIDFPLSLWSISLSQLQFSRCVSWNWDSSSQFKMKSNIGFLKQILQRKYLITVNI